MTENKYNIDALKTKEWEVLFGNSSTGTRPNRAATKNTPICLKQPDSEISSPSISLSAHEHILALDIVEFIDSPFSERIRRLNLSVRQLEREKKGLLTKELIKEVWIGKLLMLAPLFKLYLVLGIEPLFKQDRWDIHTFLLQLGASLIGHQPLVKYVSPEFPIDEQGSTLDLLVQYKDGQRHAYEVVHKGFSNIVHLAARLRGKGFSRIIYLCVDCNTAKEVRSILQSSYLDSSYRASIHCTFFAVLFKQRKMLRQNFRR